MKKSEIDKETTDQPSPRERGYWTVGEVIQYLQHSFRDGSERVKEFRITATNLRPCLRDDDRYETGTTGFQLDADLKKGVTRFP